MASVRMRELVKRFGAATIIPSLDLQIRDGEFVVFVGPSGCGKSTLLRIIAGLEPVDAGDVFIDEVRVNDLPAARRDIAMVFQDYALYPHMNVYENMAFGLQMRNMPRAEIDRRVQQTAALLRIESLLERKPKALSGGQRQRVAMGRAMVRNPKVFLFDEPLSNLDAKLRADVRTEIKALFLKLQTTMLFVTHDQVEAMTLADRIVVIRGGVVQQVGTPEEVYARPANRFVAEFIGSPTMNFFGARLDGDGVRLADGTSLSLPSERLSAVQRHGARALVLGVRPEHLRLGPEGNGALAVTASVIEPLGSDTLVYFEYEGTRHVARVSPELHPRVGERLALAPSMTQAHLFDANDGVALR